MWHQQRVQTTFAATCDASCKLECRPSIDRAVDQRENPIYATRLPARYDAHVDRRRAGTLQNISDDAAHSIGAKYGLMESDQYPTGSNLIGGVHDVAGGIIGPQ